LGGESDPMWEYSVFLFKNSDILIIYLFYGQGIFSLLLIKETLYY
jgi:hypothetical protein